MKGKRYTMTEVDQVIKEHRAGKDLKTIAIERKISAPTLKKWIANDQQDLRKGNEKKEIAMLQRKINNYEAIIVDQADTIRILKSMTVARGRAML
jgi:hypothetical protein